MKQKEKLNMTVLVIFITLTFVLKVSVVYGFLGYSIYRLLSYFYYYKKRKIWDVVFYFSLVIALVIALMLTSQCCDV